MLHAKEKRWYCNCYFWISSEMGLYEITFHQDRWSFTCNPNTHTFIHSLMSKTIDLITFSLQSNLTNALSLVLEVQLVSNPHPSCYWVAPTKSLMMIPISLYDNQWLVIFRSYLTTLTTSLDNIISRNANPMTYRFNSQVSKNKHSLSSLSPLSFKTTGK